MNRLEYIPGDLVTYNGNIVTIENNDGYYATYYDEDESLQEINVNVIKGIPLTPEILEKNGWEKDEEISFKTQLYYRKKSISKFIVIIIRKDTLRIVYNNECLNIIQYVHKLQHLLFGLDLNHEMEV